MKLFLDASVLLAACGRPAGGSRAVCDLAAAQSWRLLASDFVMREVEKNVRLRLPASAQNEWQRLKPLLEVMTDVVTFDWPVVFPAAKDRPVLFTAAATADVLLTLDRADFWRRDGRGILRPAGDETGRLSPPRARGGPVHLAHAHLRRPRPHTEPLPGLSNAGSFRRIGTNQPGGLAAALKKGPIPSDPR